MPKYKRCSKCKKYKSRDNFYNNKSFPGGKSWWCKNCNKKAVKPIHSLYGRLRYRHDMSYEDYTKQLKQQDNVCAICESNVPGYDRRLFCVDHNHRTGKKRGLLYYACNLGLGKFKDDIGILKSALKYLRKYL